MKSFDITWEIHARLGSALAVLFAQNQVIDLDYHAGELMISSMYEQGDVLFTVTSRINQAWPVRVTDVVQVQKLSDLDLVKVLVQQRIKYLRTEIDSLTAAKEVAAGALIVDRCLLMAQRSYPSELAGLWELPGGKVEQGESPSQALVREWQEELGVTVAVGSQIGVDVQLKTGRVLRAYEVRMMSGQLHPTEHQGIRWVDGNSLKQLNIVEADRVWIPDLLQRLID
ncbi:MAG: (deoxy)nucleoside triphosphate pyrophosphohydrolase [Mycobacteriaceae bacterium]